MDLTSPSVELAAKWLEMRFEFSKAHKDNLGWRVGTSNLYAMYKSWARSSTSKEMVTVEDLWGIIQLQHPWVTIVGPKGNRSFTGMRIKGG